LHDCIGLTTSSAARRGDRNHPAAQGGRCRGSSGRGSSEATARPSRPRTRNGFRGRGHVRRLRARLPVG